MAQSTDQAAAQTEQAPAPASTKNPDSPSESLTPTHLRSGMVDTMMRRGCFPARHIAADQPQAEKGDKWTAAASRVLSMIGTGATACIIGPRGTGKTQLATEIARRVNRHKCDQWRKRREHAHSWEPSPQAVYVHVMEIFMAIKATYQREAEQGERQSLDRFTSPPVLVIDEVQERGETDWENRMLTYILDKRYQQGRDTLLLANMKPTDIQDKLGASIVSRMQETGGIVECNWPSFRGGAK